jgi:hypothetical protein
MIHKTYSVQHYVIKFVIDLRQVSEGLDSKRLKDVILEQNIKEVVMVMIVW